MKNIYKLYLNHFIIYFIGFALLSWSFEYFEVSKSLFKEIIIKSSLFGVILSWTAIRRYIKELKIKGFSTDDENLKIIYNKVISSKDTNDEILSKISKSVDFKINKIDKTEKELKLNNNYSWYSWGEIIEIKIRNSEKNNIEISSRPNSIITLTDNGRNQENVEKIAALIKNVA